MESLHEILDELRGEPREWAQAAIGVALFFGACWAVLL